MTSLLVRISGYPWWRDLAVIKLVRSESRFFEAHCIVTSLILAIGLFLYGKFGGQNGIMTCFFGKNSERINQDFSFAEAACLAKNLYSVFLNTSKKHDSLDLETLPPDQLHYLQPAHNHLREQGIIGVQSLEANNYDGTVTYKSFYHLTPFIILLQWIICLAPYYSWYCFEGRRMKNFCTHILPFDVSGFSNKPSRKEWKKYVGEYYLNSMGFNSTYAYVYIACEVGCVLGDLLQIYLLDLVTDDAFSKLGVGGVVSFLMTANQSNKLLTRAFPMMGKCTVNLVGPGGNIVPYSGVCTMPLNLVSRVFFAFLWVYFNMMLVFGLIGLLDRTLLISSCRFRWGKMMGVSRVERVKVERLKKVVTLYGDWYILNRIMSNVDPSDFDDVVEEIVGGGLMVERHDDESGGGGERGEV